ncbi:unnamed protein product [Caenorhabditis angaria]|uniref:T20D4.11-like domain-containing protein n=1 Tax=Caenorhabditis angaria TaxID=860376 RepID=A0A9P1ITA0_9PELO|nr:unnamed protein product [Caenorhabditis angaria]
MYPENDRVLRNCQSYEKCVSRLFCNQQVSEVRKTKRKCEKYQFFNDLKPCLDKITENAEKNPESCYNKVKVNSEGNYCRQWAVGKPCIVKEVRLRCEKETYQKLEVYMKYSCERY